MFALETDVCVDMYRGHSPSIEAVAALEQQGPLVVTAPTLQELVEGAYVAPDPVHAEARLRRFLTAFEVLDYDASAAWIAGRIVAELSTAGKPIGDMDSMIAATAIAHNAVLVTRNLRHFGRVRGLQVRPL